MHINGRYNEAGTEKWHLKIGNSYYIDVFLILCCKLIYVLENHSEKDLLVCVKESVIRNIKRQCYLKPDSQKMFQNAMTPSQMYQSFFRTLPLVPQPVVTSSASFLVENLLRDGQSALISRPLSSLPTAAVGIPGLGISTVPTLVRGVDSASLETPTSSPNDLNRGNSVTPYLKFGVNAILGSENKDNKSSKYF